MDEKREINIPSGDVKLNVNLIEDYYQSPNDALKTIVVFNAWEGTDQIKLEVDVPLATLKEMINHQLS
jgi:hypothetical protein